MKKSVRLAYVSDSLVWYVIYFISQIPVFFAARLFLFRGVSEETHDNIIWHL